MTPPASAGRVVGQLAVEDRDEIRLRIPRRSTAGQGKPLLKPVVRPVDPKATVKSDWRELFKGIYLKHALMISVLWIATPSTTA
jgi:hypothetical protein